MMSRVIESLQNGVDEGVHIVNSTIDDAIYVDPEKQAEIQAYDEAEVEVNAEQSRIDKMNAKMDEKVDNVHEKVNDINQSFDHGVQKTKEKLKDVSRSRFMQVYRAMRMVHWGNLAANYVSGHPEWMNDLKNFGKSAASKLKEFGISDATDDMTETEQICARRDAMFGSPDAGIAVETVPTTDMILSGAELPVMGLESLALEAVI